MLVLSTRMYLCRMDQLLRCSCLTCFSRRFASLEKAEHSGSKHEPRFPSFPPIHGHAQIEPQNTFPFEKSAPRDLSPSHGLKKTVSDIGHTLEVVVVLTYSFSPGVPLKDWACAGCATLAFLRREKFHTPFTSFSSATASVRLVRLLS